MNNFFLISGFEAAQNRPETRRWIERAQERVSSVDFLSNLSVMPAETLWTEETAGVHGYGILSPEKDDILVPASLVEAVFIEDADNFWASHIFA